MTSANKSLAKTNFPSGWKCYKTIGSYISCAFIEIWNTWEVWRALKKLELLEHLSCSPNFCVLHISMNARWRMNQFLIVSYCLTLRKYFGMFFRDEAHLGGSYLWSCARLFAFISEELREKLTRYILYVSSVYQHLTLSLQSSSSSLFMFCLMRGT